MSEIKIITKEDLANAKESEILSGYVYLKNFDKQITKNGEEMYRGIICVQTEISFVTFNSYKAFDVLKEDLKKSIINCKLQVKLYNGKKNFSLLEILGKCNDISITKDMFCPPDKYNVEQNAEEFISFMEEKLSDKGFDLFLNIFGLNEDGTLFEAFKNGYAATTNHDNLKGGLLAHSFKCVKILDYFIKNYNWLNNISTKELENSELKDLLYLGLAIHDIGKTKEIDENLYLENSFNSHRILGAEMLFSYKDLIIDLYNEHFYNLLISILVGHHDIYDDKAKTIYAFIAHKIDEIESLMTDLDQRFDFSIQEGPQGSYINYNDEHSKLFI